MSHALVTVSSMAGTMREKKPGVWELRVQAGRDPLKGTYRQRSKTVYGTKAAASKALAKLVTEAEALGPNASNATFEVLLNRWLELRTPGMSPTTVTRYRYAIDKHIVPALGDRQVRRLRAEEFDVFYAALSAKMKPSSVVKIHNVCSAALKQAVRWGWIARNVTEQANKPKPGKWNHRLPPMEDVRALLLRASAWDEAFGRLLWVKLALGLRRGEIAALRWSDVDPINMTVKIERQAVELEDRKILIKDTKWDSRRSVAIDASTLSVLESQITAMKQRTEGQLVNDPYVWSDSFDCAIPWRPTRITRSFIRLTKPEMRDPKETREQAEKRWKGIELRLHDLRHLNGTHLSNLGVDIATISHRLGHSRISTTVDFYVQRVTESDRAAASVMSGTMKNQAS